MPKLPWYNSATGGSPLPQLGDFLWSENGLTAGVSPFVLFSAGSTAEYFDVNVLIIVVATDTGGATATITVHWTDPTVGAQSIPSTQSLGGAAGTYLVGTFQVMAAAGTSVTLDIVLDQPMISGSFNASACFRRAA